MDLVATARRMMANSLVIDSGIAAVLTLMAQVQAGWSTSVIDRVLLGGMTGVVALRRRVPLATCLSVGVLCALMAVTPQQPSVFGEYLAVILAAYTVAERCRLPWAIVGGLAMVAGVIAHDLASTDYNSAGAIAGDLVVPVLIWGLGRIVHFQYRRVDHSQRLLEQLERDRAELARIAVETERAHLARELHDVVTHSVSVVVIQAQGAQRVLEPDQPDVRQALRDIEAAGRTALGEMRRLLGLLRDDEQRRPHAPQPGFADISGLLSQVRAAGLAVSFTQTGPPPNLDPGADLSVYRVIQEALTNALKYAPNAHVSVDVQCEGPMLDVYVQDDGADASADGAGGRGLLGMRERMAIFGGTLEAGPRADGGFIVRARLPMTVQAAT